MTTSEPSPAVQAEGRGPGTAAADALPAKRASLVRRMARDKFAVIGGVLMLLLVFLAVFAPWIAPYPPDELFVGDKWEGLSASHWLGTDHLGRDVASRIVFGARVAIRVAAQIVAMTLAMAVPLGLLAGFLGRRTDSIIMRLMDALHSIPTLMLALTFAGAFGLSFNWALFGTALAQTPTMTRLVRAQTLAVREETFIESSRSIGTPMLTILRRRVLPNVSSPIIVQASILVGIAILVEAALSILGIGVPPGTAAWGSMLEEAFQSIYTNSSNVLIPGLAITITVLAANLLGDGLRDALGLDPGQRYGARTKMGLTLAARRDMARLTREEDGSDGVIDTVLSVRDLTVEVKTEGGTFSVVKDISFDVGRGQVVGLVGESGSGKTVTSMALMRLLTSPPFEVTSGEVVLDGNDLLSASMQELRSIRGRDIAMIFQDPMAALNPSQRVGHQIAEVVRLHEDVSQREAERRAVEMLERVGIPDPVARAQNFPHEFSGGMRQRAMIAMALACSPKLLIADEPTTALDVTIQAQILELLKDLQREFGLSIIFVTHDLGVVADICDRVLVMYSGQIVEEASSNDLFEHPSHPYTAALLAATPQVTGDSVDPVAIPGTVPSIENFPAGCRFHTRCPVAIDACAADTVPLVTLDTGTSSRCIRVDSSTDARLLLEAHRATPHDEADPMISGERTEPPVETPSERGGHEVGRP